MGRKKRAVDKVGHDPALLLSRIAELEKQVARLQEQPKKTSSPVHRSFHETFFNLLDALFFILDQEGVILHVNNVVLDRLGYSKEELIGQSVLKVHPPRQRREAERILKGILEGQSEVCTVPLVTKDRQLIPVETHVAKGEWNNHPAIFGVIKDLSRLLQSEEKFAKAFHSSAVLMALSTLDEGRYLDVNETFERTLGYSREEVIGRTSLELGLFVRPEQRVEMLRAIREFGLIRNMEVQVRTKDGKVITGLFSGDPITLDGKPCWLTVVTDITERKLAAEELEHQHYLLATLINSLPIAVLAKDAASGRFIQWNRFAELLFGLPADETLGKTDFDFFPRHQAEFFRQKDQEAIVSGKQVDIPEEWIDTLGRGRRLMRTTKIPLLDREGIPSMLLVVSEDITERKRAVEQLRFQSSILDQIRDHVTATDLQGRITYVNDAVCRFTGKTRDELLGKQTIVFGEDPQSGATQQEILQSTLKKGGWKGEVINFDTQGNRRVMFCRTWTMVDSSGKPHALCGIATDITDQKQVEERLRASEQLLASVIESQQEMICRFKPDTTLIFVNEAYCRYFGMSAQELIGIPFLSLIPEEEHAGILENLSKLDANNPILKYEHSVKRPDGSTAWQEWEDQAIFDSRGNIIEFQSVGRDITERKRIEEERRQLERTRQDFVADISHEFKTPLTAIRGYAETLLEKTISDKEKSDKFLKSILEQAIRLQKLTDNLLKASQLERGIPELEFHLVSVPDLIEFCLETVQMRLGEKKHQLSTNISPNLPLILGDPWWLRQVIQNLIDNAVEYTPEGGRISVEAVLSANKKEIEISISDTGVGIPRKDITRIFERFFRGDVNRIRKTGGTGLGLYIAKETIEAHSGRIQVKSKAGQGSTFTIILPISKKTNAGN